MVGRQRLTAVRPRSDFGTAAGFLGNEQAMRECEQATFEDLDMCLAAVTDAGSFGTDAVVTTRVSAALAEARTALENVWSDVAECHGPGEPFELWDVAQAWATVAQRLGDEASRMESNRFPATATWHSPEADAYRTLPARQQRVADQVAAAAMAVSDVLIHQASTVITAWLDLFDQLTEFGIQMTDDACQFVAAEPMEWLSIAERMAAQIRQTQTAVLDLSEQIRRLARDADRQWADLMRQCEQVLGSAEGGWPQSPAS